MRQISNNFSHDLIFHHISKFGLQQQRKEKKTAKKTAKKSKEKKRKEKNNSKENNSKENNSKENGNDKKQRKPCSAIGIDDK